MNIDLNPSKEVKVMDAISLHQALSGKYRIISPVEVTSDNLSLLYTPGVAKVAQACAETPNNTFLYTRRNSVIAVVSDGSAVLGLGNIGPYGALPVMEGKAMLFKEFGNLDAFPLCISTQDSDEIVRIVKALEPSFGGINLEDISAPRCFEILRKLDAEMSIPVFHDDQQGTAVVVLAGVINSLNLVGKKLDEVKIVVNGIGAAGYNIVKLLIEFGARHILACDIHGILNGETSLHDCHREIAKLTNPNDAKGTLSDALEDADLFIGVSKGNILNGDDVKRMNKKPIIFALANPLPEIDPNLAYENGAFIVATGRSDFPNQVNNLLVFPGIMKAAVEKQKKITKRMLVEAAITISKSIEPSRERIVPIVTDRRAHISVYERLAHM